MKARDTFGEGERGPTGLLLSGARLPVVKYLLQIWTNVLPLVLPPQGRATDPTTDEAPSSSLLIGPKKIHRWLRPLLSVAFFI